MRTSSRWTASIKIRLKEKTKRKLEQAADKNNVKISDVVRLAIDDFLNSKAANLLNLR